MSGWAEAERYLYWTVFSTAFLAVGFWETYRPSRPLVASNTRRWAVNIVLATLAQLIVLLTPVGVTLVAVAAASNPYGLLNRAWIPFPVQCLLAVAALDFIRWVQHFAFHRLGILWRMHRVHHSDPDCDLTTGLRFHPGEALVTQGSYLAAVHLLAPPPAVALGVEVAHVAQNFFGHANVSLPAKLDGFLRRLIVTPDLHRVHHSARPDEQNHNYGSLFPWWDRLLGTYLDRSAAGTREMQIGLDGYPHAAATNLVKILRHPFEG